MNVNAAHDDVDVPWSPGWDWLAAVAALHILVVVPWVAAVGPWSAVVGALSMAYHAGVFLRREQWRLALVEDTVTVFEPPRDGQPAATAKLRGPLWLTHRLLVVRTSRRVLLLRAGRYDPALFARLRRAFLALGGPAGG